jgi:hypothetical protein
MDGVDWDTDGPADVDDLEVARPDELVHGAPAHSERLAGVFDGQEQYETTTIPVVGGRGCG